jgi:hypothetical protein
VFRKNTVAIILLTLCLGRVAWAEDTYVIEQIHFLPPTFYVGDLVELRVRVDVESGIIPTEPLEIPPPSWVHIRDVRVIPISGDYDIRISFSSYETGTRELPPVVMGDLILTGLEIETKSITGGDVTKIEEAFNPSLLPGSRLLLALIVGGLLIVPVLGIVSFSWFRRLVTSVLRLHRERRPYRKLKQSLDDLKNSPSPVDNRTFYITLSDGLKGYLSLRLDQDFASLTSREMQETLIGRFAEMPSMRRIAAELSRFDTVKFGGETASAGRRAQDVAAVRDAAVSLEAHNSGARSDKRKRRPKRVDA